MTKSAAQRAAEVLTELSSFHRQEKQQLYQDILREDRQRRQMKRAIVEAYEPSCDCATCKLARRLRKEAK